MAPKARVRKKAAAAALASANIWKKQLSLYFVESIPTDGETAPTSIASPGVNEAETTAAMDIECFWPAFWH